MNDYKIKELYEEMEKELISSMKRNFKRHLKEEEKTGFQYTQWQVEKLKELSRYRKQNKLIIGDYTNGIHKEVSKHIQEEVKQGSIRAIKQYNKALGKNLKPDKIMNESFFKTNDRKVDALIKVVNDDLKTANTSALRMINDQYRQVIHKSAFFVGNGVFTEQQAVRMATDELTELKKTELAIDESNKDFLAGGLNCIEYKNGRRVNIASYAQMAVRTANLRAQLMGEGDFRKAIGRVLVQATSHGGACPICQKWEKHIFIDDVYSGGTKEDGKYMLLSEAMEQGFLHPNCRHGLTTYYPELEGIENETDEEYQADLDYINERMNYCDRNIKKYDRLEHGSISKLNIQQFANKKKQWQNEKNILLQSQYYENVTEEWLKNATPNSHEIVFDDFFIDDDGVRHPIKGKEAMELQSEKSIECYRAKWLEKTFGHEVHLVPRIIDISNSGEGVHTPDFLWQGKKWDLKTPEKAEFQNTIETFTKKKKQKLQAKKLIIDFKNYSSYSDEEIIKLVDNQFKKPSRSWLEEIMIVREEKLIGIYSRK